eukprot:6406715-Amphidinium_carterae.1
MARGMQNRSPLLMQLYKTGTSLHSTKYTEERMKDLLSPVCAGTYSVVTAERQGRSKQALLDSLECWKHKRNGLLAINWLQEYFLRSEKFSQLLLFPDMSAVVELLDGYSCLDGHGVWKKRCDSDQYKKVWPNRNGGLGFCRLSLLRTEPGRQHGTMTVQHITLADTNKLLMEMFQDLEGTVGIPVIPVSAHLEIIEHSLRHKLQQYKPRWIVLQLRYH